MCIRDRVKVVHRIEELGYKIKLSREAKEFIADKGFDKQYGARPLKRAIQKYIEDLLAEEIVNNRLTEGDHIILDLEDSKNSLVVQRSTATENAD